MHCGDGHHLQHPIREWDDHSFTSCSINNWCIRGEGQTNLVFGFLRNRQRLVLRLRKESLLGGREKTPDAVLRQQRHINSAILPLAVLHNSQQFIPPSELIQIRGEHLATILKDTGVKMPIKLPSADALYAAVLSRDVCYLPIPEDLVEPKQQISVELKAKMGRTQADPLHPDVKYCWNCLTQIHKWLKDPNYKPYDYCPMDLFSENPSRMLKAFRSLLANPHKHLSVRKGGQIVFDCDQICSEAALMALLFPESKDLQVDFLQLLCQMLTGRFETQSDPNGTQSALKFISVGCQMGSSSIRQINEIYQQQIGMDKSSMDTEDENLSNFAVRATLADCSIVVTLASMDSDEMPTGLNYPSNCIKVTSNSAGRNFWFSISLVDLDLKPIDRIPNYFQRYEDVLKFLQVNNGICPVKSPCDMT